MGPVRLDPGLLDRSRNNESFALWREASALQDLNANGTIEFAVRQNPVRHHDVGSLVKFIDDDIFNSGGFHQCNLW